jgi:hypothetical protein
VYDNYSLAHVFSQKQSQYEQQLWRRSNFRASRDGLLAAANQNTIQVPAF